MDHPLLEAMEQAVMAFELDGRCTFANEAAAQLLGICVTDLLNGAGAGSLKLTLTQQLETTSALASGRAWREEAVITRPSGETIAVRVSDTPVKDAEGRVVSRLRVMVDTSGRRIAEARSADGLALMRLQLETSPDAVLLVLGDKLFDCNRRFLDLWSLGTSLFSLDLEGFLQAVERKTEDATCLRSALISSAGGGRSSGELVTTDGRILACIVQHGPWGGPQCRAVLFRDITLDRQVESLLRTSAEQQYALAAVSHTALRESNLQVVYDEALQCVARTLDLEMCVLLETPPGRPARIEAQLEWMKEPRPEARDFAPWIDGVLAKQGQAVLLPALPPPSGSEASTYLVGCTGLAVALCLPTGPHGVLFALTRNARRAQAPDSAFLAAIGNILSEAIRRHRVEEALRLSEEQWRSVVEMSPDGICVMQEGAWVFVNRRFVGMLGYTSPEELKEAGLMTVMHPEDRARMLARNRTSPDDRGSYAPESFRLISREGRILVTDISTMSFEYRGKPASISVVRDVTHQKQLQSQLMLSDRMASVGRLAAGVAHELNNPLAYIHSNIVFARGAVSQGVDAMTFEDKEEVSRALTEAEQGADRMRVIIRDLKSFSRADEDKREPVSLRQVLETSINMSWNEIRHRSQLVRTYERDVYVQANEGRLAQVFVNLLINAAQAIREGDVSENTIEVALFAADGRAVVEIRDTGTGIPASELSRIFDPFFTTKPVGVGSGLGLPICHSIVTALDGTIEVESRVGVGTTFRVTLPEGEKQSVLPPLLAAAESPPAPPQRRRILLLDDDVLVLKSLTRTLRKEYDVVATSNPVEVFDRARGGEHFDVILCDVMMPLMNGVEVYQQLKTVAPHWLHNFAFFTGGAFTDRAQQLLNEVEAVPKLEKPVAPDVLRRFLKERLEHPAPPKGSAASAA